MAEPVKSFPAKSRTVNGYDWNSWFDGQIWKLQAGVDFKTSVPVFRAYINMESRERGVKVVTRFAKDEGCLYIQAIGTSTA